MPAFPATALLFTAPVVSTMSKLLFRLRNVPEDEADEVRALLLQNEIDFFETFAGNWGISLPALWLKDETQFTRARELIDVYQQERQKRVREDFERRKLQGEVKTIWHVFLENPLRCLIYISLAGLVLFFSVQIFLSL